MFSIEENIIGHKYLGDLRHQGGNELSTTTVDRAWFPG